MDILGGIVSFAGNFFSGGFLGLLGSVIPLVIHYFQSKQDYAHEAAMRKLDIEAARERADQELQKIDLSGQWDSFKAAIDAQARPSGVKWIDGLSSFVRPFLTLYWGVAVYTGVKIAQFMVLQTAAPQADYAALILKVWFSDFDQQVIGAVILYWFGQRTAAKRQAGGA